MKILKQTGASTILTAVALLSACSLSGLVDVDNPQVGTEIDHKYLDTKDGALSMLYSTLGSLQAGVTKASFEVGTLTDELTSKPYTVGNDYNYSSGLRQNSDARLNMQLHGILQKGLIFDAYNDLQSARIKATHARHFLRRRTDNSLDYAVSASYSYEGYAIMMIAENVCSGVPLSEVPYGQKAIYGKSISTESLLEIAISKFDSALAIEHDSIRFKTLAKIGKGRALMSLGSYAAAYEAVTDVDVAESYTLHYTDATSPGSAPKYFWTTPSLSGNRGHHIVNLEGLNGLTWYVNPLLRDPRLPITIDSLRDGIVWKYSYPLYTQQRKFLNGTVTFKLASYIDKKMIEAEHLLSQNDANWIDAINSARRTVGLADTLSPIQMSDKVDLLFRERAFWFYGNAVRLSDMRRLVRQYGRDVNTVYPTGFYNKSEDTYSYGDAVVFVPSVGEFTENYEYTGCINREP